jgi:hypothetical protein
VTRFLDIADPARGEEAGEFQGRFLGASVSVIVVDAPPGGGPRLHRHPYEELFVVQEGSATFTAGDDVIEARVGHLFGAVRHPGTGEPYTSADVARMSAGVLTEEEVEGMRTGAIADPTVGQVAALAAVFGVEPSFLVDRKEAPTLDAELMDAMRDETTREITREALRLPKRERKIVLGIVRQFGQAR